MSERQDSTTGHQGHVARMEREFRRLEKTIADQEHRFSGFGSGALSYLAAGAARLSADIEIAVSEADSALEDTQELDDMAGIGAAYEGEAEAQREEHRGRYARRRRLPW